MKRRLSLLLILVLVLTVLWVSCSPAPSGGTTASPAAPQRIRILGLSMGGATYAFAAAMAALLNKQIPEINWSSSAGVSEENVLRIISGEEKIGFASNRGYADVMGSKTSRLLTLFSPLDVQPWFYVVPKNAPYEYLHDLPKGLVFSGGSKNFAVSTAKRALVAAGLSPDHITWRDMSTEATVVAYSDQTIEGTAVSGSLPYPALEQMASSKRGLKVLKMTKEEVDKWETAIQGDYEAKRVTVPKGAMAFITSDVDTLVQFQIMGVRDDFPEELAYKIVKAVWENVGQISSVLKPAEACKPELTVQLRMSTVPLHPGTVRYLKEKGFIK